MTNCILIYKGDKKVSKKEKAKKPFFKKWWFWLIAIIVISGIIGAGGEEEKVEGNTSKKVENTVQTENNDNKEEGEKDPKPKKKNFTIDINEELNFKLFDVVVEKVKVYEKGNKILADIKMKYTNRDYQYGDTKTFFVSTLFDVKQNNVDLEEINNAWDVENKNRSDVFFPNAAGGTTGIKLTYELKNSETPIDLIFTPTTETEGTETVTIDITE
jgi:hypothetical protein